MLVAKDVVVSIMGDEVVRGGEEDGVVCVDDVVELQEVDDVEVEDVGSTVLGGGGGGVTRVGSPSSSSSVTVVVVTAVVGWMSMMEIVVDRICVWVVGSAVTVSILVSGGEDLTIVVVVGVGV